MSLLAAELTNRVNNVFKGLGLGEDQVKACLSYLEGADPEPRILAEMPQLDMLQLHERVKESLGRTLQFLQKHEQNYAAPYLQLLFAIGHKNLITVLRPYLGLSLANLMQELDKYDVPQEHVVAWYADEAVDYTIDITAGAYFDRIYERDQKALVQGWKLAGINGQVCLGAFLVARNPLKQQELKKWLENVLVNSIPNLFADRQRYQSDIDSMVKYVKGGLFSGDSLLLTIKRNTASAGVNRYILFLLAYASYLIYPHSQVAKRLLKLFLYNSSDEVLTFLHSGQHGEHQKANAERLEQLKTVVHRCGLPQEIYIAWLGSRSVASASFRAFLVAEFAEDRASFAKAVAVSKDWGTIYLCKLLWEHGLGENYVSHAEDAFVTGFGQVLASNNVNQTLITEYQAFLQGEKEFAAIKGGLKKVLPDYGFNMDQLGYCVWFKEVSPIFLRTVRLLAYIGGYYVLGTKVFYQFALEPDKNLRDFTALLEEAGIEQGQILAFLTFWALTIWYGDRLLEPAKQEIQAMLTTNPDKIVAGIPACSAEGRAYLLEQLFLLDREKYTSLLVQYMEDSAKAVREKIIGLLGKYQAAFDAVHACLGAKKQAVRECAVHILAHWQDERSIQVLTEAFAIEKSEKVRVAMATILKVSAKAEREEVSDLNLLEYCQGELKKIRGGSLDWLNVETLPPVRYQAGEELADPAIIKYLLLSWNAVINFHALLKVPAKSETDKLAGYLNRQDLAQLALEVLNRWLAGGAEAKKKWVMPLAAALGDTRVISALKQKIEEWPLHARGAIACDAVRALALSGEDMALLLIDSVSRKFKFRQVKETAVGVMAKLAEDLGVDPEELSDRIVPNLGFDRRGEQILDFGPRSFTARLNQNLELEIFDESGKKYKSLPAPGKNDDPAKAKAAGDYFKAIKKQLKTVTGIQALRLEGALATDRKWTGEKWQSLFVDNPIMQQYATSLIWGSYLEDKLAETFRYMEDGSFNTLAEEEYELPAEAMIGLVHPIELESSAIEAWRQQLADYEITQPFTQLTRPVYRLNQDELQGKWVERFGGICLNGLSLLGKLTKDGWYRGSVVDGGWYNTFYKENKRSGVGAELSFSGVGIGGEDEEVTVYLLQFYRPGTVERGSYVYDEVNDQKRIKPGEVPGRLFSEVLLEVDKSTSAKLRINPDWRLEAKI